MLAYLWAKLKLRDLRASAGLLVGMVSPDMSDCRSVVVLGLASFLWWAGPGNSEDPGVGAHPLVVMLGPWLVLTYWWVEPGLGITHAGP